MGKSKHLEKIINLFNKSPIVDYNSLKRIIGSEYTKLSVSNLLKQKKINKIMKGYYSLSDDPTIAVLCVKPAYLGLQSAMSHHGIWEQETIPIIITANPIRTGIRKIFNTNVLFRKTNRNKIFGYEYLIEGKHYLPISDIEKTFIDMTVFRQAISEEALEEFKKRINKKKLEEYTKKYSKKARTTIMNRLL